MSCTHGVVYYFNLLFWAESARDHVDALLSFKRFPTCYISDVAGQVARHMNNRTKQQFFQPNDGRLCANTPVNCNQASAGKLEIKVPWVEKLHHVVSTEHSGGDRFTALHPVTQTKERYSLYDRFHQKKQTRPEEKLRSLDICPDLRTELNTSVAEQLNQRLASVRRSLCVMKEPHFKQTVRILFELQNEKMNHQYAEGMRKRMGLPLEIGQHGQLSLKSIGERQ